MISLTRALLPLPRLFLLKSSASTGVAIFLLLLIGSIADAVIKPPAVTLTVPEVIYITAGKEARSIIKASVPAGFHVQSNPASEEYLIPTKIEIDAGNGLKVHEVTYPKGRPFRLKGSESDISVYEGTFEMTLVLTAENTSPPGERVIKGKFTYQACDDKSCLRPATSTFELLVRVEKSGA